MNCQKVRPLAQHLPAAFIGISIGAVLMYSTHQFPLLIEARWGVVEKRITIDSRDVPYKCVVKTIATARKTDISNSHSQ